MAATFVRIGNYPTADIDNTGQVIFYKDNPCFLDAIWLTNKTDANIFVDIIHFQEQVEDDVTTTVKTYEFMKHLLEPYESKELKKGSILNVTSADILYANSDYSDHIFDSTISYRELISP